MNSIFLSSEDIMGGGGGGGGRKLTQTSLVRLGHLYEGVVLLVEEDLHTSYVTVNAWGSRQVR